MHNTTSIRAITLFLAAVVFILFQLFPKTPAILDPASYNLLSYKRINADGNFQADPYRQPGYLWRSKDIAETRWIPYDTDTLLEELPVNHGDGPPKSALSRAAPDLLRRLAQNFSAINPELEYLRDSHIAFMCDSHCVNLVDGFCNFLNPAGSIFIQDVHLFASCNLPSINFTMTNLFHYGAVHRNSSWSQYVFSQPGPPMFEDRLDQILVPKLNFTGPPTLIVFDSAYWDSLHYAERSRFFENGEDDYPARPYGLAYSELAHHRRRVSEMILSIRAHFPRVPLMWKPAHLRWRKDIGSVDISHFNDSNRALMKLLKIPVFEWASKITGEYDYVDGQHLTPRSTPTWLAVDMSLYYLHRYKKAGRVKTIARYF